MAFTRNVKWYINTATFVSKTPSNQLNPRKKEGPKNEAVIQKLIFYHMLIFVDIVKSIVHKTIKMHLFSIIFHTLCDVHLVPY